MSSSLKRKSSASSRVDSGPSKRRFAEVEAQPNAEPPAGEADESNEKDDAPMEPDSTDSFTPTLSSNDRAARFAVLRARNLSSRKANLAETKWETRRTAIDPSQLTGLNRKKDIAQHKLLKADVEASGEDFERKRAWDWTIEESEKWDERLAEKQRKRDEAGFADFRAEAGKVYERQIGAMGKVDVEERKEAYERQKREAVEQSIRSGGLEIVETENGELIAVDKDGSFLSTADSLTTSFGNKPDKASVDRLVEDIRKAEEMRLRKRRERRGKEEGDGDVTFINEKNKQFNMKLARFYDKYTSEIRDSFERGTAV